MLLAELLQEKLHWTVLELIDAIKTIQAELKKDDQTPTITVKADELVFEVGGADVAPLLKQHLKPFIIKTFYDREGPNTKYHYYLHRSLVTGEMTRLNRAINSA